MSRTWSGRRLRAKGEESIHSTEEAVCLQNKLLIPQIFTEHIVYASLGLGLGRYIIHDPGETHKTSSFAGPVHKMRNLDSGPCTRLRSSQTRVLKPRDYVKRSTGVGEKNTETSILKNIQIFMCIFKLKTKKL